MGPNIKKENLNEGHSHGNQSQSTNAVSHCDHHLELSKYSFLLISHKTLVRDHVTKSYGCGCDETEVSSRAKVPTFPFRENLSSKKKVANNEEKADHYGDGNLGD